MIRCNPILILLTVSLVLYGRSAPAAEVTLEPSVRYQTIEGWGTCMISWSLSNVPYGDQAWREAYRDLGLNILRVPMHKEVLVHSSGDLRDAVSLGLDLSANIRLMDFTIPKVRTSGDMAAWLKANALEPDRVKIVGSIWSPPHWMKGPTGKTQYHVRNPRVSKPTPWLSRTTYGDSIGGRLLQSSSNLDQFGRYVAAWVKGFEQQYGAPVYAVSLQNEVSFENPFDSATYSSGPAGEKQQWWQYANALAAVRDELRRLGLSTKLKGPHMANVGTSPSNPWRLWEQTGFIQAVKSHSDPSLIDALDFYNSNGYMGSNTDAVKMWAAYYLGKDQVPGGWEPTAGGFPGVKQDGKPIWLSENGGASGNWLNGEGGTPGSNGIITLPQKMHNAIVHADASAYIYWQMTDTNDDESKHTLLGKAHVSNPHASKKYVAFKHFSRYVRPGAVRIRATFADGETSTGGASIYDTANALNVSAFVHDTDNTSTIVLVNMMPSSQSVTIDVSQLGAVTTYRIYVTTDSLSFQQQSDLSVSAGLIYLTAPAYSAITLVGALTGRAPDDGGHTTTDGTSASLIGR
jgi:O-glycosyl hydrolase